MDEVFSNPNYSLEATVEGVSPALMLLMEACIRSAASGRPSLKQFKEAITRERSPVHANFSATLIKTLQKHQDELENMVLIRTEELKVEMSKVDELLSSMLPRQVIMKLRNQEEILPESFDCVTLMFSDIPEFNDLVAACTPIDVITVLTDLYMVLDDKLHDFNVYKVETIRDCYMVASGLPERNGDEHVCEIARTAISFLRAISQVKHVQSQESLKIRIGINSGPVVATVIGNKLPHYCLVGDTVNTASRMESTGLESRIHLSHSTYQLLKSRDAFQIQYRGKTAIKGKGDQDTYWLLDTIL